LIYVALLEGVALLATALTFANIIRWQIREQARERSTLINQVMFLSGHTWLPAPASEVEPEPEPEPLEVYYAPEQMPDEFFAEGL